MIIQVDRVASVEEAVEFRDAGATLIGVSVDPHPLLEDGRFVSVETAKAIQAAVAPARLVGLAPRHFDDRDAAGDDGCTPQGRARLERVLALAPDFVQTHRGDTDCPGLLLASGLPVIDDGPDVCADHGVFINPADPASFVRMQVDTSLQPALSHLDVVADRDNPWQFLTEVAPDVGEGFLQVADIAETARDLPLLLSLMGLGPEDVVPYTRAFPHARGFFGRLGLDAEWGGPRTSRPEPLLAALRALQASAREESPG